MIKLLIRFWPVLVPLLLYLVWFLFFRKKREAEEVTPQWEAWFWIGTLVVSLLIAIVMLVIMGVSTPSDTEGTYVPAKYEDGKIIPAHREREGQ